MGEPFSHFRQSVERRPEILKAGRWNKAEYSKARGLFGRTIALLGYGNIGQEVARRAHAFGMPVVVWSRRFSRYRTPPCWT